MQGQCGHMGLAPALASFLYLFFKLYPPGKVRMGLSMAFALRRSPELASSGEGCWLVSHAVHIVGALVLDSQAEDLLGTSPLGPPTPPGAVMLRTKWHQRMTINGHEGYF